MQARVLHLTTHLNTGGITTYIQKLIVPLGKFGFKVYVGSSGGEYAQAFAELGASLVHFSIKTKSELHPKLWFAFPKLIRFIKNEKIDLLHAHTRITQVLASYAGKITGIPVITTCHGFYKRRLGRRLFPAWGDKVIAISDGVADSLTNDFHVEKNKIAIIYNGVNVKDLDIAYSKHEGVKVRESYGIQPQDPVLGVIARLVEDKGHEFLIRAVAQLKNDFPTMKLLIVGDGKYRETLVRRTKEWGIFDSVRFLGNVPDVTKPLSAIDIFVLPATWREGFGLSIVEAMTCYKPTIVTNIWALNTLIQDHITGIMVTPKEVEPIVSSVRKYLMYPEFREQIAVNGRKMVEEKFSIQRMAQEIKTIYESLISS